MTRIARWAALVALLAALAGGARAGTPEGGPAVLRVATSGDYAPFSRRTADGSLEGFDVALVRRFAEETGRHVEWVPFRWPELEALARAGAFDLAAGGITVRPERSLAGRFTTPLAESGALLLVPEGGAASLDALDRPDRVLAVNAGGHLERAARARFPRATIRAVPDNDAVLDALRRGEAHAVVTDTLEALAWQARLPGLAALGPFTRDRKAWWVRADDPALAAELDAWLLAREADGGLAAARARWLGAPGPRTATPAAALVAAMDERLALMPLVAEAKRGAGRAVHDPARERRVLAAARADVAAAAERADRCAPTERCVGDLFSAQMAAARAIQERRLARPAPAARTTAPPDLETALRPALGRLGTRIAEALVRLPPGTDGEALAREAWAGLRSADLDAASREPLVDALRRCAPTPAAPDGGGADCGGGALP